MKRKTLYVAYGSNLNIPQMRVRCPLARVYGVGRIEGYRLVFKALGAYAFATIEPCACEHVPVVVWEIERSDEISLDRYEGYPVHYYKETVEVSIGDEVVEAMVYIMNKKARYAQPNRAYVETIEEGYRRFGLQKYKLYEALYGYRIKDSGESILKHYRLVCGLTQKQLACRSGVKEGLIQKYESGERALQKGRGDILSKLAKAMGIPVEEFMSEKEEEILVKNTVICPTRLEI